MKPTMFRNPRLVLLAFAAIALSACAGGEHVLRTGEDSYQIEAYVMTDWRHGNDPMQFRARALLKAAEVAQSKGREFFRVQGQKTYAYRGADIIIPTGSGVIMVPGPTPPPPGRDTGRYRIWIELLEGGAAAGEDELIFDAAQVIVAFPNVKALADRLEKAPEHEGGFETEERL